MEVRDVLATRLKKHRMSLGLNQLELAEKTKIPYQVINRLEHGHQSIYVERLVALATALDVSMDYLVGLTDNPTPAPKRPRARKTAPVG